MQLMKHNILKNNSFEQKKLKVKTISPVNILQLFKVNSTCLTIFGHQLTL